MSANITAKIAFNGLIRVVEIDAENPKWTDFEGQIRRSHSIPANIPIVATYRDEDGDVISLDTDGELADYVNNARRQGSRSIRFEILTREVPEDPASFVLVGTNNQSVATPGSVTPATTPAQAPTAATSEPVRDADDDVDAMNVDPTPEPKGKEPIAPGSSVASDAAATSTLPPDTSNASSSTSSKSDAPQEQQQQQQTSNPDAFVNSIENLINQVASEIESNPEVFERLGNAMGQIAEQAQVGIGAVAEEFRRAWEERGAGARDGAEGGPRGFRDVMEEFRRAWEARAAGEAGEAGEAGPRGFGGFPGGFPFAAFQGPHPFSGPGVHPGFRGPCGMRGGRCGPRPGSSNGGEKENEESEYKEQREQLKSMGFYDDVQNSALLRRYYGNVDRVVEILVRE
ncbi:hypothetical protein HK102_013726 [Quaeritorhiza haematococci]|nr:hypothetical protein HK102_013726 [Quaeritorhiza haematococci]